MLVASVRHVCCRSSGFLQRSAGAQEIVSLLASTRTASYCTSDVPVRSWHCRRVLPPQLLSCKDPPPRSVLSGDDLERRRTDIHNVLLMANGTLPAELDDLWEEASFHICADGGANRLFDDNRLYDRDLVPKVVRGDMDSARAEVLEHFKAKGTSVIRDHCQNTTDLEKCFLSIDDHAQAIRFESSQMQVTAVGALGGNVTKELGNLHLLYRFAHYPLVLLSDRNVALLLLRGPNRLYFPDSIERAPLGCGLLPLGAPSRNICTSGLRWNLDKSDLAFGRFVSTSNEVISPVVDIVVEEPLVFMLDFD